MNHQHRTFRSFHRNLGLFSQINDDCREVMSSSQFRQRFTALLDQHKIPLESDASRLLDDTCSWLDEPTASGDVVLNAYLPQFSQVLGKIVGDLGVSDEFRNAFLALQSLVSMQEKEIVRLTKENQDLSTRLQKIEDERDLEKALLKSYDLADLFVFYYVYPIITAQPYNCKTWNDFTNQLIKLEDKLAESKITVNDLRVWLQPLESVLKVDILTLRMMTSRHTVAHTDLRSAQNQQQFVQSLSSYALPTSFAYKPLFDALTKQMQSHSSWKRKVYYNIYRSLI